MSLRFGAAFAAGAAAGTTLITGVGAPGGGVIGRGSVGFGLGISEDTPDSSMSFRK
jgi:hypothetical protein